MGTNYEVERMFFTRKVRAIYDDAIARLDRDRASGLKAIDERITSEVAKLEQRMDAVLVEIQKEAAPVEYEIKRVTDNDDAAAQKESA
jgi:prefoldin subunit 5